MTPFVPQVGRWFPPLPPLPGAGVPCLGPPAPFPPQDEDYVSEEVEAGCYGGSSEALTSGAEAAEELRGLRPAVLSLPAQRRPPAGGRGGGIAGSESKQAGLHNKSPVWGQRKGKENPKRKQKADGSKHKTHGN